MAKKKTSRKQKRELIFRMMSVVLAGGLLVFLAFYSFGWFAGGSTSGAGSMQVAVSADRYDVLVARTTEYDAGYNFITGSGELKEKLTDSGFSLSATATSASSKIAYELVNEYTYESKKYLMPGSYGTLTFYLKPKGTGDFTASLTIDVGAYVIVYDSKTSTSSMEEVTSEPVLNMLKGHLLFFTGRTGSTYEDYKYTGLVQNGNFSYDTSEHEKCDEVGKTDCYKVTLYWEWPITYYDIADNVSDPPPAEAKKYPEETMTYLEQHPDYFFAVTPADDRAETMSDAYNDGDQTIGDGTNCIVVYIDAH